MAKTEEKYIRVRTAKDTTANWEKANPILFDGEMALEDKGGGKLAAKIGDGITPWKKLPYYAKPMAETEAEIAEFEQNTQKQLESNKANLQNQIDNIVLEASGNGDVTPEVVQARVDKNKSHATLKDRLDNMDKSAIGKADTIEWLKEHGDINRMYILPDGYVYGGVATETRTDEVLTCKNYLPLAANSDDTAYVGTNGEKGYKTGYRISSSGTEKEAAGYECTGFIPAVKGDTIRIKNVTQATMTTDGSAYCVAYFFTSDYAKATGAIQLVDLTPDGNGIYTLTVPSYDNIAFFRVTLKGTSADTVITVNEEITTTTVEIVVSSDWGVIGDSKKKIANYEKQIAYLEAETAEHTRMFEMLKEDSSALLYTNLLPTATDSDRKTIYEGKGYITDHRLSSSGAIAKQIGTCASGYISAKVGDILRIKGIQSASGVNSYIISYDSSNTKVAHYQYYLDASYNNSVCTYENDILTVHLTSEVFGTGWDAIRFSTGTIDENTVVTINEELIKTDTDNTEEPEESVDKLELIKKWDAPIYDANIPVFELSAEKNAITSAEKTVSAVYGKYDALMTKYPQYITKTNLGMCSDGVTPVYRYDFREPEPHRGTTGKKEWSETKSKAIIVSGIHWEWGGIFALYNALEEIAENPKLHDLRRNTHLIVLPVCNPYAVANQSVRNANQVEIHRNFEVDFIYPGEAGYIEIGERSHGGTEPLSEIETQYIDNIMKENADAAFFLTCHSYQSDSIWGTGFTWASPATYYMCNLHYRVIDKISKSWMNRFGETLSQGIADYKTENLADGDTRFGSAYLSTTNGTETKQATKYGIQAVNVEVCDTFWAHGTKANPEATLSSFTMSRGAETYVNFLLTAFGCYDYKDKALYT